MDPSVRGKQLIDAFLFHKTDIEALKLLQNTKAVDFTIVNNGDHAIHLAAKCGSVRVIQLMQSLGADIHQRNENGNVAMHFAARGGHIDLVRYLCENGADANSLNNDGETPLHEAVKTQTMDIIETCVDLGMNPNIPNSKTRETPLHTAMRCGAAEAMEGLLVKGAKPDVRNKDGERPEDVAANESIKGKLRMYATMMKAVSSGFIRAKGIKITHIDVAKPLKIDRVGIIIDTIDIPKDTPTGIYCRRELAENSSVPLKKFEEESHYSDVFHIHIFDVNSQCKAKIYLPLYQSPSEKEELVIRFIRNAQEDHPNAKWETINQVHYCLLETVLIPGSACICNVNMRPKKEVRKIKTGGATITSEMDEHFSMEVPPGSFQEETVLGIKVFESNTDGVEKLIDPTITQPESKADLKAEEKALRELHERKAQGKSLGRTDSDKTLLEKPSSVGKHFADKRHCNSYLLTDVFQINVAGKQPKRGIKMQIPFCKDKHSGEEIVIITANEETLKEKHKVVLEVLPVKPQIIGGNIVFEVSHFSIFVASWKKKALVKEELKEIQRQISNVRERRKPVTFFAVVKQIEGREHVLVVECVVASRSRERRKNWIDKEGFKEQNPPETGAIMISPGDTFCIDIEGNASFEDRDNAVTRKLQFSQCRPSWQPYHLILHDDIYDVEDAYAYIKIMKKSDKGLEEEARLRMKLTPPQQPPPPPPEQLYSASVPEKRCKSVNITSTRHRKLTRSISDQLSSKDRMSEIVSKINRKDYKPERSIGETLLSFFGRRSHFGRQSSFPGNSRAVSGRPATVCSASTLRK